MWFKIENQHVQLKILVKPNAKRTRLVAVTENELSIALHAKPHQGQANRELIEYLSTLLDIPKTRIVLQRGELSRHKMVLVPINESVRLLMAKPEEFCEKWG